MITLVRHGRTTLNAQGRLLGRLDPPLDEVGEQQADSAAAALSDQTFTRVVSSPLLRTRMTAERIAGALGLEVEIDERWIELDYGSLDGAPLAEVAEDVWAAWRADADFCPDGGECLSALGARVRDACGSIGDDDVLVVSHVSPIKAAAAWALAAGDLTAWRMFLAPGSVTRIAVRGGTPSLHLWNWVP